MENISIVIHRVLLFWIGRTRSNLVVDFFNGIGEKNEMGIFRQDTLVNNQWSHMW